MRYNYYVSFKLNGSWTPYLNFKRPIMSDAPLDESLDTGIIVDVPSDLRKIPPFTLCRIATYNADDTSNIAEPLDVQYFLTGDREAEAVSIFQ